MSNKRFLSIWKVRKSNVSCLSESKTMNLLLHSRWMHRCTGNSHRKNRRMYTPVETELSIISQLQCFRSLQFSTFLWLHCKHEMFMIDKQTLFTINILLMNTPNKKTATHSQQPYEPFRRHSQQIIIISHKSFQSSASLERKQLPFHCPLHANTMFIYLTRRRIAHEMCSKKWLGSDQLKWNYNQSGCFSHSIRCWSSHMLDWLRCRFHFRSRASRIHTMHIKIRYRTVVVCD